MREPRRGHAGGPRLAVGARRGPAASRPGPRAQHARGLSVRVLVVNAGSAASSCRVLDDERTGRGHDRRALGGRRAPRAAAGVPRRAADGVDAVGHRVVHGGPRLHRAGACRRRACSPTSTRSPTWRPLHNPRAVAGDPRRRRLLPGRARGGLLRHRVPRHASPRRPRTYALPAEWNQRCRLRRYGFHGLSHAYAVRRGGGAGRRDRSRSSGSCPATSVPGRRWPRCADGRLGRHHDGLHAAGRPGHGAPGPGSVDPGLLLWLLEHGGRDPRPARRGARARRPG